MKGYWKIFCALLMLPLAVQATEEQTPAGFKWERVVIFSCHGLRAPVVSDEAEFATLTLYSWGKVVGAVRLSCSKKHAA